jgi:tetratricopeptide (TPR) repeat protein
MHRAARFVTASLPADEWPPLLPAERKQVQGRFEQACRALSATRPNRLAIFDLLVACVERDPGNSLYLAPFLANIRLAWDDGWRGSWTRFFASAAPWREMVQQARWREVVPAALERLRRDPTDTSLFAALAEACEHFEWQEAAVHWLTTGLHLHGDSILLRRAVARCYARWGHSEEAHHAWRALTELLPNDPEALAALTHWPPPTDHYLAEVARLEGTVANRAEAVDAYRRLAALHMANHRPAAAEAALTQALALRGQDLALQEELEVVQLAHAKSRLELAQRSSPQGAASVRILQAALLRMELALFARRRERYPQESQWTWETAERLKQLGNFAEARKLFQELTPPDSLAPRAQLEQGTCLQHLRNFPKAVAAYREAAAMAERMQDTETLKLALYRSGMLAIASGDPQGEGELWRLATLDPNYRDLPSWLDKRRSIGQNT